MNRIRALRTWALDENGGITQLFVRLQLADRRIKVTGGQLREIRAVVHGVPKGTGAGWPTAP